MLGSACALALGPVWANEVEAPHALIRRVAGAALDKVKNDPALRVGNLDKIMALVDNDLMPIVDFERMTASAVGRFWRQATPAQQAQLQVEFKRLLVRTYAGALARIKDQTLEIKAARVPAEATETVVRSRLMGAGEPVQIDYRMEKQAVGWKVYDLNVMGIWLVDTYKNQFATEIQANGVAGLIVNLAERNRKGA